MLGKKFETLEDWTKFLSGKSVYIIRESHPNYRDKCKFVEMIGNNNLIAHPDNNNGNAIRMKVKTITGQILFLIPGDFFVEERNPIVHLPNRLK
jgi:hypothetical protein